MFLAVPPLAGLLMLVLVTLELLKPIWRWAQQVAPKATPTAAAA